MTPFLTTHIIASLITLVIGGYIIIAQPRGMISRRIHRRLGYVYAVAMVVISIQSFWIRYLAAGRLSVIHFLSVFSLISVIWGIKAARDHNVAAHRLLIRGSYAGVVAAFVAYLVIPRHPYPFTAINVPTLVVGSLVIIGICGLAVRRTRSVTKTRPSR